MPTTPASGLRYPALSDNPNGPLQIQNLATDADSQLNSRFTSTATRNAAIPAPVVGQVCIVNGYPQVYRAGAWRGTQSFIFTANPITSATAYNATANVMRTIAIPDPGTPYRVLVDSRIEALVSPGSNWNYTARIDTVSGELIRPVAGVTSSSYLEINIFGGASGTLTGAHDVVFCSEKISGAPGDGFQISGVSNLQTYRVLVIPV